MTLPAAVAALILPLASGLTQPATHAPPGGGVAGIMREMANRCSAIEKILGEDEAGQELLNHAAGLEDLFEHLKGGYRPFYGRRAEQWRELCDQGASALREMRAALQGKDMPSARKAFLRVQEIRDRSHAQFRPGLFKRLLGLVFGSQETHAR